MNNKEKRLFKEYSKLFPAMKDFHNLSEDDQAYYMKGFEEWKRLRKEYGYYRYMQYGY